eukprot:scaffold472_cov264-Pinguiococcus_pyrenoidosus.AAC.3
MNMNMNMNMYMSQLVHCRRIASRSSAEGLRSADGCCLLAWRQRKDVLASSRMSVQEGRASKTSVRQTCVAVWASHKKRKRS